MSRCRALLPIALALGTFAPDAGAGLPAPPVFEWSRCPAGYCDTGWYASPAVGDVDGDGQVEVLWGGYRLMAVDGATGTLEWTWPPSGNHGRLWPSPVVADLDGTPGLEIAIGNGHGELVVLDGTGSPEPGFPTQPFGTSNELRSLAAADLDGDGALELLTGRTGSGPTVWSVVQSNGATRPGWPRLQGGDLGYAAGCYNQNLGAGDLDGDGLPEVVATSDVHYLATFEADGTQRGVSEVFRAFGDRRVWAQVGVHFEEAVDLFGYVDCGSAARDHRRPNLASAAPVVSDLDRDGVPETVIVGDFYDPCVSYDLLFQLPVVFAPDRRRWAAGPYDWSVTPDPDAASAPLSVDYDEIESVQPNPMVVDLDGDELREIVFPSSDGRLHAFWLDGTEKHGWPIDLNPGAAAGIRFASEAVSADLDGDGRLEVLFHVWTGKGSNLDGELRIVDWQGQPLASVPIARNGKSWSGALGAPTLANIDADPALEVLSGTTSMGLVAHELPGSAGARLVWATSRGGFTRAAPEPEAGAGALAALCALAALARQVSPRRLRRTRALRAPGSRPEPVPGRGGLASRTRAWIPASRRELSWPRPPSASSCSPPSWLRRPAATRSSTASSSAASFSSTGRWRRDRFRPPTGSTTSRHASRTRAPCPTRSWPG